MPALVIYTPKKKLIRIATVSTALVATCIWMLAFPTEEVETLETVAAYLGIPFFGLVGLFSLSRLLWPTPAVVSNFN